MIGGDSKAAGAIGFPSPEHRLASLSRESNAPKGFISEFFEWFGDLGIFFWQVLRAAVTPPFEFRELFRQLDEIGSKSLPLVALAGAEFFRAIPKP